MLYARLAQAESPEASASLVRYSDGYRQYRRCAVIGKKIVLVGSRRLDTATAEGEGAANCQLSYSEEVARVDDDDSRLTTYEIS